MRGIGQTTSVKHEQHRPGAVVGGGILLGGVLVFVGAVGLSLLNGPGPGPGVSLNPGAATATVTATAAARFQLPVLHSPEHPAVQARLSRGIPPSVMAGADLRPVPWAPGLRLRQTELRGTWADYRAVVEDAKTGDRRSYAIGDLLPHGSLLVGISTGAVQVLVADVELIELTTQGSLRSLNDFRTADEARPLRRAPELAPEYVEGAQDTLQATLSQDPAVVQRAIDELIAAGEPAVELIVPWVDSEAPVVPFSYAFPSRDGPRLRPQQQGDIVVGVLEALTGQSFGDVFEPTITAQRRREIAGAWKRWWGL